jgi:hypothetical protein
MRDKGERKNRREKHRIHSLLDSPELLFYDSASHPSARPT